jgi:quinol monooxygenase YgiN
LPATGEIAFLLQNSSAERIADMTIVIATIKVQEDKVEEATTFFKKLAADVKANEPGTLVYTLNQRKDDPTVFMAYEKYESDQALGIHSQNLGKKAADFGALLAGPAEIVILDEI